MLQHNHQTNYKHIQTYNTGHALTPKVVLLRRLKLELTASCVSVSNRVPNKIDFELYQLEQFLLPQQAKLFK